MKIPAAALVAGVYRGCIELRQGLNLIANYVFFPTIAIVIMYFLRDFRIAEDGPSLGVYAIPGIVAMNVLFTSLMGVASALLTEREDGTLLRVRTVPHGTVGYLVGKVLSQIALTMATFVVVMTLAIVLFDGFAPDLLSILSLLWILPLGIAAMLPLGIAIGALVKQPRQLSFLSLLLMGMTAVAGVFYPLGLQSSVLQAIGQSTPLYWLGLGMRSALLPDDAAQVEVDGSWKTVETAFALGAWAVAATLLALYALRRMTHRTAGSRSSILRRRRDQTLPVPEEGVADSRRRNPAIAAPIGKIGPDGWTHPSRGPQ
ncbi:ABC transporter permease [Kocuria marina]|uniref:ABC transporter permease n=1 Tax=Kocuria marina TaxID=223184 RepID=UPI0011A1676B|nr:ABC transporter permease [Kocuria indica]